MPKPARVPVPDPGGLMKGADGSPARKRVRLSPDVRAQQILDAALVEFSQHGFAGTRIEDIAHRAGLSKSGVYAHYASKEEIFEALLDRAFAPLDVVPPPDGTPRSIEAFVERFIATSYARLSDASMVAMVRLMIAESVRIPELIRRWHNEILTPFHDAQTRVLRDAVARGLLRRSPLTDDFSLAYAPILYAIVKDMVLPDGVPGISVSSLRDAHRDMMLALLREP